MLVYSPDVKRQLPGGQKTAARVTPQRITKSERNSAVLKNTFFGCRRRRLLLRRVRAEYRVALESLENQPGKIVDNPRFADDDPDTKIYEREPTETIDQEECDFG